MHEKSCEFLATYRGERHPRAVLRNLCDVLEGELSRLREAVTADSFDALWDFGGYVGLVAAEGLDVCAARAGDVRVYALGSRSKVLATENTLRAQLITAGRIDEDADVPHHLITGYIGGGHLPDDLTVDVDPATTERIVISTHGAVRRLSAADLDRALSSPSTWVADLLAHDSPRAHDSGGTRAIAVIRLAT